MWFIFFLRCSGMKLIISNGLKGLVYLECLKYVIARQICALSGYFKSVPNHQVPLPGITVDYIV